MLLKINNLAEKNKQILRTTLHCREAMLRYCSTQGSRSMLGWITRDASPRKSSKCYARWGVCTQSNAGYGPETSYGSSVENPDGQGGTREGQCVGKAPGGCKDFYGVWLS